MHGSNFKVSGNDSPSSSGVRSGLVQQMGEGVGTGAVLRAAALTSAQFTPPPPPPPPPPSVASSSPPTQQQRAGRPESVGRVGRVGQKGGGGLTLE